MIEHRREDGSIPRPDPNLPLDEFGEGIEKDIVDPDVKDVLAETETEGYGAGELRAELEEYTANSPQISGGDVDADWERGEAVGEETVGGSTPTPDQDVVDELGAATGIVYGDREELRSKPDENDANRWELDPRSSPGYRNRVEREFNEPEEGDAPE